MLINANFPRQALAYSLKNKDWRKKCMDWADSKTIFRFSPVRNSVRHMRINQDLVNNKIHMEDIKVILNPYDIESTYSQDKLQHYPIINSKLNVLRGEEYNRVFDSRVIVTNPDAVSQIEENKETQVTQQLQQLIESESQSKEDFNNKLQKLGDYFTYSWQDDMEVRANYLLNHYSKEYNFQLLFNDGFMDGLVHAEEIYQCDIVGGEPVIRRLNPMKVRIFKSGYSNKIEDADMIIIEDYWSPGKVIDTFYDVLCQSDIDYIEKLPDSTGVAAVDSMDNVDPRYGMVNGNMISDVFENTYNGAEIFEGDTAYNSLLPYDFNGNVRVIQLYWKSKRKIKRVKSYNPETGEEEFNFYPETYKVNKITGEEAQTLWINEAWEGTKIGDEIYVNMRPRIVQYNRLDNPSRCHFGIVGSIYNYNQSKPVSLVDMAKPFCYMYDIIHDRLTRAIADNWGKIVTLDLALIPKGWEVDKWLYFAKLNHIAVKDSFKEGNIGAATGKLAGGIAQNSSGVIDAEFGNNIQQYIQLLEFIKTELAEVVGISRQREGNISNRETVGGVERSTQQSSQITQWLFSIHDDTKRRALECFLETAKIAMRGRTKKFQYILPDKSMSLITIDGDEFANNDYGIVVDNSNSTQLLNQNIDTIAQAAIQNNKLDISTICKLYSSCSISEKIRMIEASEQRMEQAQQQSEQQAAQQQQQNIQAQVSIKNAEIEQKKEANQNDNQTKLEIAKLQYDNTQDDADDDGIKDQDNSTKEALLEKMREFDARLSLDKDKLNENKRQFNVGNKAKANGTK